MEASQKKTTGRARAPRTAVAAGKPERSRRSHKKEGVKPGKVPWIHGTKLAFFTKRVDEWRAESAAGSVSVARWYTRITNLYLLKYGHNMADDEDLAEDVPDPTNPDEKLPDSDDLSEEEANRRSENALRIRGRIAAWYCRTYRTVEQSDKQLFASILGDSENRGPDYPRKPQEIHFYSRKYYDERVKARFERTWKVEVERAEALGQSSEDLKEIKVRNRVTKEVFEEESEDFRAELKLAVEAEHKAAIRAWELTRVETPTRTPAEINAALKNAGFYLEPLAEAIATKFMLNCSILICGPVGRGGAIEVRSVHAGTTRGLSQQKWFQFDPKGYGETEKSMILFSERCFSEEECRARAPDESASASGPAADGVSSSPGEPARASGPVLLRGPVVAGANAGDAARNANASGGESSGAGSGGAGGGHEGGAGGVDEGGAGGVDEGGAEGGDEGGAGGGDEGGAGGGDEGGAEGGDKGGAEGGDEGGAEGGDEGGAGGGRQGEGEGGKGGGAGGAEKGDGEGREDGESEGHSAWRQLVSEEWHPETRKAYSVFWRGREEFGVVWGDCVGTWVELERASGFNNDGGQLTADHRPKPVSDFLGKGRRWETLMPVGRVGSKGEGATYASKWWKWWAEITEGKGAGKLATMYGRTGFMLVLGSLLWWGMEKRGPAWEEAAKAVTRVMREVVASGKIVAKEKAVVEERKQADDYDEEEDNDGEDEEGGRGRVTRAKKQRKAGKDAELTEAAAKKRGRKRA
ncbi:hypothetical protein C8F04DRAFT_1193678 [Mycena alexandri]|uniref:Uncharacterized protein n=1 Tax=Mycena alexandri TaxID=1745969 RepID=A0AAD6SCV8_9AGAR|nr:hypothetical protein C8F04DRAFT_1193678 [Mycena alexandri]